MAAPQFQTLREFIAEPFHNGSANVPTEWKNSAEKFTFQGKVRLMKILEYEGSFFYNIEVPSESNPSLHYDVVIQFIPPDNTTAKRDNIRNYYVKFFSNSPGFVYKYAALYYLHGFLIDNLASKLGTGFLKAPEKTNPDMKLGYDKSIYFASMLILRHNYFYSFKDTFFVKRTKNLNEFLKGVFEFDDVMTSIEVENLRKSTKKQLEKDKEAAKKQRQGAKDSNKSQTNRSGVVAKHGAVKSTFTGANPMKKISQKRSKIMAKSSIKSTFNKHK